MTNSETKAEDVVINLTGDTENLHFEDAIDNTNSIRHNPNESNAQQKHNNISPLPKTPPKSTESSVHTPIEIKSRVDGVNVNASLKLPPKLIKHKAHMAKYKHQKSSDVPSSASKNVSNDDIMNFMRELQATFVLQTTAINDKIDAKINAMQVDLTTKINELATSVDERFNTIHEKFEEHTVPVVEKLVRPFTQAIETRIDKLEREALMLELIVTGFPLHPNENLELLVNRMCAVVGFENGIDGLSTYYRISHNSNGNKQLNKQSTISIKSPPIILKFWTFDLKQHFFKRYLTKKSLNLVDFGFSTSARIYINESLTTYNQKLLLQAKQMQKNKTIHQCHTYRGQVFIKVRDNSPNQCIFSMDDLLHLQHMAHNV